MLKYFSLGVPPLRSPYRRCVTWASPVPQLALAAMLALSLTSVSHAQARSNDRFPHAKHEKLFPTCESCHAGISRKGEPTFPSTQSCAECHNGTDVKRVDWSVARRDSRDVVVRFAHDTHFTQTDSAGRVCAACHTAAQDGRWMSVGGAKPESCFSCHTHRTPDHFAPSNRCTTCHSPLARSARISTARIGDFPKPASHQSSTFLVSHGPKDSIAAATCATCHAKQSCLRCHVNGASLGQSRAIEGDSRIASLVKGKLPTYPTPDDHRFASFITQHGTAAAANTQRCATCHTQPSCATCHVGTAGRQVLRQMPKEAEGGAGVRLIRDRAATVGVRERSAAARLAVENTGAAQDTSARVVRPHARGFSTDHATAARSGALTCTGCHAQRFCSDCHAGEARRAFHPVNFVSKHAASVYSGDRQCTSCHNTEVFCRSCHVANGLGSARNSKTQAVHSAQPQWLLQHGQAARQELTSCATCHTQSSCMRCHSTTGWGVNPHGRNFDADRLGKKAPFLCATCHIADPRRR